MHICMLGEVEISGAPQNAHHTFSQDIGSSIQHQTSTFMASFTAHFFDFRFVKLDLRREHKWNPNELQHLSWPYDQHHPFNTNSHFWIPQMASPCYHLILFTFLLYEYWNNKFLFVQISYIMSIVQKKVEGCTN